MNNILSLLTEKKNKSKKIIEYFLLNLNNDRMAVYRWKKKKKMKKFFDDWIFNKWFHKLLIFLIFEVFFDDFLFTYNSMKIK